MFSKKMCYILMTCLVCLWGLDYIVAKTALSVLEPMCLLFFKYSTGLFLIFIIKMIRDRKFPLKARDIPLLFLCSIFGEILYYYGEYTAITYLPVSVVTIMLAFVPMLSILIERILYKKTPSKSMMIGICCSIIGITLVLGADIRQILNGQVIGYLFALMAVVSWNIYNFLTRRLTEDYDAVTLTMYQMICTVLLSFPLMLRSLPDPGTVTPIVVAQVMYLGLFSAGIGFMIQVKSLSVLGETPCSLFINFMPVTATFFGWILLNETITLLQLFGGVVVIAAGCFVINQKEKRDLYYESLQNLEKEKEIA